MHLFLLLSSDRDRIFFRFPRDMHPIYPLTEQLTSRSCCFPPHLLLVLPCCSSCSEQHTYTDGLTYVQNRHRVQFCYLHLSSSTRLGEGTISFLHKPWEPLQGWEMSPFDSSTLSILADARQKSLNCLACPSRLPRPIIAMVVVSKSA